MAICYISDRKLEHWSNKDVSKRENVILTGKRDAMPECTITEMASSIISYSIAKLRV